MPQVLALLSILAINSSDMAGPESSRHQGTCVAPTLATLNLHLEDVKAGKSSDGGLSEGWGLVFAALITVLGTFITVTLTNRITLETFKSGLAKERQRITLDFKTRQLNDLYGPLILLVGQSKSLHERLVQERKGTPGEWALLDDMEKCVADPLCAQLVKEIIEIGNQVEQSLITKGGLISGPQPPLSFSRYLAHFRILKMSYEMKKNIRKNPEEYFPKDFPEDLGRAYREIQSERAILLSTN